MISSQQQANAWRETFKLCRTLGMSYKSGKSGREAVNSFIRTLRKDTEALRKLAWMLDEALVKIHMLVDGRLTAPPDFVQQIAEIAKQAIDVKETKT